MRRDSQVSILARFFRSICPRERMADPTETVHATLNYVAPARVSAARPTRPRENRAPWFDEKTWRATGLALAADA